jgi:hypothetical protein
MQGELKAEWSALPCACRQRLEGSAACTALAVEHQRASGMEITGTALGRMMQPMPHALSVYWQGWRATEYVNSMAQQR